MPCVPFKSADGQTTGFMCTSRDRQPRCACGKAGVRRCDWKMTRRKSGTCDKPLCATCSTQPAPDKDLCPEHAAEWKARGER